MSNLNILRPVNQQFIQYPYWIAQDNQFSFEEKGLLTNLLSFKDSFHKSALSRFASNGKRSIERAWKGLITKGILIAQRLKVNNRFDWSYTVNLEQISKTPKVDYAEIALRHGVSEEVARAISEEAFSQTQSSASKSEKPVVEIEKTPIPVAEIEKPIVEIEKTPVPVVEMDLWMPTMEIDVFCNPHFFELEAAKPTISEEKQPILPSQSPTTPKTDPIIRPKSALPAPEINQQYAEILLHDKKLRDYLQIESPSFEVKPEMIVAFQKRLEMNEIVHPHYEKYAQHFRNWLPEFLKYQQMGNQFQSAKKKKDSEKTEKDEKCGTNKAFNIPRKKLQNPQSDYMTYQSWVIELSQITENLSPTDLEYQKELLATQKAGKLRERYERFKAKNAAVPVPNK